MYSQIARNKRRTVLIMFGFIALFGLIGYAASLYFQNLASLPIVLMIAFGYAIISYLASSRLALKINGARQIRQKDNPRLYRVVENLSITTGLPMPRVYLIDDLAPNAFATGRNPKSAAVAASTGLLEMMTDSELEGVMAHELGHIQNYDIRLMVVVFACVSAIGLLTDFLARLLWFGGDDDNNSSPLAIVVVLATAILAPLIATLVQLAVSRRREYLADASGALTTRYPEGLASALEKIEKSGSVMRRQNSSTAHLFFANPLRKKRLAQLFSTHPPIADRVAKLRTMGDKL